MTKKRAEKQDVAPEDELIDAAREVIAALDALPSGSASRRGRLGAAVERLRKLVPGPPPPAAEVESLEARAPSTQEAWDARVLEWALAFEAPITLERALTALAPDAPAGSSAHRAIAGSLSRLPRDRFTVSWYMANTALAPSWTRSK